MRRTLATCASALAGLALAVGLTTGCGGGTQPDASAPDQSAAPSSTAPQSLPAVTFEVTKQTGTGSIKYEVAIDSQGQWRITGDVSRSGTLTADQTRTLAAAINSEEFVKQMAAKRGIGAGECAAVLPDYYWVLQTRGAKATNSCPPKRPVVDQVVALIRQYSGA